VYVEKPFTIHVEDAEVLVALSTRRGLKLTVGHDDQFSHVTRRLRSLVRGGYLGGPPVHMDSSYCYDLGDGYARALLGDRHHWIRRLPAEFLSGDRPQVMAHAFVSPRLAAMGEREIVDELRVIIRDERSTTASFTFSSQLRPTLHQFRIYGRAGGLVLDQDQETLIKVRGARFKSYGEKFVPPVTLAAQHLGNAVRNLGIFLARDFHMKSGMKYLIESFYRSIVDDGPVPIPYREIVLTARIMHEIFEQIGSASTNIPSRSGGVMLQVR
jgi:predicted dehydrogenase